MTGNRALLTNFMEKFLGTVRFGNNDFAMIAGYGDGLEVAFRKSTCFVRNKDGVDLLTGDCSLNLYAISLNEVASNSSTCLLAKASSSQSWLWHQRLSHLNFATINNLVKNNLVQDEASDVIISFIKKTQVNLQLQVQRVRTDNGTEFNNKTLAKFFDEVGITQRFSAARTPQQNGVVERRNRTLVEAARTMLTMLTFANLPLFLWAEAIAIAYFTQNRSIIHKRFDKTPYELMNKRKPNIKFFHVFVFRCYLLNDYEDVRKLKAKWILECLLDIQKSMLLSEFTTNELIMKSSTTNVETSNVKIPSNEEEVFHESPESFQEESSSSSLNNDVQQSSEEVEIPLSNTQSVLNNMVPNVDEANTSHNVFNEHL
nr:integrase, catalytic region, zinc finger, CCHC-type, peptidase aspartic, catalytic [Tanacetum cinerariifolium]